MCRVDYMVDCAICGCICFTGDPWEEQPEAISQPDGKYICIDCFKEKVNVAQVKGHN